jgi:Flp pilus assembly protein TadG
MKFFKFLHRENSMQRKPGQVGLLMLIMLPVLLGFAGLSIDIGNAYRIRAKLSKSIDAAALEAMQNLNLGQSAALTIAQNAFNANYGANPPPVNITYTKDANNNMLVNVNATTTINTFFLRVLTGLKTLNVSSSAQATRNPLVMSLVLDQSYSMTVNGGQQALPPAVNDFVSHFDDTQDYVADIEFATLASISVAMTQPFVSKIQSAVNSMQFGSGPDGQRTNAYLGMQDALTQLQGAPISGPNVRKVVVFFTDGWANIIQDNLACTKGSTVTTPMLYCGCDPGDYSNGLCSGVFFFTTSGTQTTCPALGFTSTSATNSGNGTVSGATFPSQQNGPETLYPAIATGMTNCANDADYRTVQLANSMRAQNIVVYSIGLGNAINKSFLQQVANDPASSTYNPSQPVGEAVFAPTSATLDSVFSVIASKILLRLTE